VVLHSLSIMAAVQKKEKLAIPVKHTVLSIYFVDGRGSRHGHNSQCIQSRKF